MILKKPYGFLIKRFRIIHIILTILTIFIAVSSRNIISFFRRFISSGYSVTVVDNMASQYINWSIYLIIILVITILIAIYILLRTKKKPHKIYMAAIIYYIILFIGIIIASFLIDSLSESLWSTAAARTYRDIAQIIYYPQFFFIIVLGLRALGFNVKQFDFKNDLKELEITDEDSEEVELNINFQTYKAERFIRRFIREIYYYYLENKLIFTIIFVIIIVIAVFTFFKGYEKIRYTYDEGESFNYNGFQINITDSILTNVDLAGNQIVEDRYYLVIKMNITNNNRNNAKLDYNNLKIYLGGDYINPSLDIGNHFLDYGTPFMGRELSAGQSSTYIIPYILTENQVHNDYRITIYTGAAEKSKDFLATTINVNLHPARMFDVEVVRNAKLNEEVSFSSTLLDNTSLTIKSATIARRYEYTYESCYRESCRTYTGLVLANNSAQTSQTLLIMDYDFVIDEETAAYQNINNIKAFADHFITLEYLQNDEYHETNIFNVTPTRVNDKLIFQVPVTVEASEEVNLLITIRNRCYKIRIK